VLGFDDDGAELTQLTFHGQHVADNGNVHTPAANIANQNGQPPVWRDCLVTIPEALT